MKGDKETMKKDFKVGVFIDYLRQDNSYYACCVAVVFIGTKEKCEEYVINHQWLLKGKEYFKIYD